MSQTSKKNISETFDDNMIEKLQQIQDEKGFLPKESLVNIAKEFNISLTKLYGVITFYSFFKLNKGAKNKIQVCNGTACHVRGAEDLTKKITEVLNIEEDEVTENGVFSLEVVRCLGMCASAPLIRINDEVFPKLKVESIKQIIDNCEE